MILPNNFIPISHEFLWEIENSKYDFEMDESQFLLKINSATIQVVQNDIIQEKVDAIAYGANPALLCDGGISQIIVEKGGQKV